MADKMNQDDIDRVLLANSHNNKLIGSKQRAFDEIFDTVGTVSEKCCD